MSQGHAMRTIVLRVEYAGGDFLGWQLQPDGRTVQGEMEAAAARATGVDTRVVIKGAGRTDAGVHAMGQVAQFDTASGLDCDTLARAINYWLPDDVAVLTACEPAAAAEGKRFNVRFSALSKLYRYRLLSSHVRRPMRARFCTRVEPGLDVAAMRRCASVLAGEHDFASFTSEKQEGQDTVRTIMRSEWVEEDEELRYEVEGNGFLYNMVRALVGTMIEAGRGKLAPDEFGRVLGRRDRRAAGPTAPARGLTLVEVRYGPQWGLPW